MPKVLLIFKDFGVWLRDASCVGLNVAGYSTAKVLNANGIDTVVAPVRHNVDLVRAIDKYNTPDDPLTNVIISAPWLTVYDLKNILEAHPDINFVILSHSNVGFLQADPWGVQLLRAYYDLSFVYPNIRIGGNSVKFVEWVRVVFGEGIVYLPNLYYVARECVKPAWDGQVPIKIGSFGAIRPEKNFMTAAAAALAIQSELEVPVELHMSSGGEGDRGRTAPAIDQMCENTGVRVIRHDWQYWDAFIQLVRQMDLMIQVSYTESFNMVTADGISVGVPSVVSSAIAWAPDSWKADSDNALAVARTGIKLLTKNRERKKGLKALLQHDERGLNDWRCYLKHFGE